MAQVICLCVSDLHLCHTCPPARSAEPNWYQAMLRPIDELRDLQKTHRCPVICAGDIFDSWNSSPELINFAIKYLPEMTAIPGQHDLPYHEYKNLYKSAYNTLEKASVLWGMSDGLVVGNNFRLHKFPWGIEVRPNTTKMKVEIALIHSMIWMKGYTYPGAPKTSNITSWKPQLKGYDVAVFGDNHSGFIKKLDNCTILNCGSFIRCKSNEMDYKPFIGMILEDGSVTRYYLNTSKDKWIDPIEDTFPISTVGLKNLMEELRDISIDHLDFKEAINRYLKDNDVNPNVQKILTSVIDKSIL
ncbi:MAG: metallophosphoesterase [Bacillota bacterium]